MYSYDNPFSSWNKSGTGQSSVPSLYGALPYPTPSPPSSLITFYITSFNPTVLNCTVIGPDQQHVCYIVTDPQMPGYTIFRSAAGKSIALVEWQSHPQVEVRGVFSKRKVKDWLNLSPDKSFRFMEVAGMRYSWVPQDKSINLYTTGTSPQFLARISRGQGTIMLDMTNDAIQLGLLDTSIIATLLLQCGRNID